MRNSGISSDDPRSVLIIGAGRAGRNLALGLQRGGSDVSLLCSPRTPMTNASDWLPGVHILHHDAPRQITSSATVIFAVQDDRLASTINACRELFSEWSDRPCCHLSGLHSSKVLDPLKDLGALTAACHPCLAFPEGAPQDRIFHDAWFDVEGEDEALTCFESLITSLGANTFRITPDQKAAVHLASVLYSNFPVILAGMAHLVQEASGISPELHWRPYRPLLRSMIDNLDRFPPGKALSGPLARGDAETLLRHLGELGQHGQEAVSLYKDLCRMGLKLFGEDVRNASEIRRLLDLASRKPGS